MNGLLQFQNQYLLRGSIYSEDRATLLYRDRDTAPKRSTARIDKRLIGIKFARFLLRI